MPNWCNNYVVTNNKTKEIYNKFLELSKDKRITDHYYEEGCSNFSFESAWDTPQDLLEQLSNCFPDEEILVFYEEGGNLVFGFTLYTNDKKLDFSLDSDNWENNDEDWGKGLARKLSEQLGVELTDSDGFLCENKCFDFAIKKFIK